MAKLKFGPVIIISHTKKETAIANTTTQTRLNIKQEQFQNRNNKTNIYSEFKTPSNYWAVLRGKIDKQI